MLPSSDPDTTHETSSSSDNHLPARRTAQKHSTVNIPSRKDRKNGAGKKSGVAAAVVEYASQMPENARPPSPAMTPSDSPPGSLGEQDQAPRRHTANLTTPLLDALSSNHFRGSTAQNTNEWARNVPAFSSSPGNLISLSDSPPTMPSSYNDERGPYPSSWHQRERGVSNHITTASSPHPNRLSTTFTMDGHHEQYKNAFNPRRASVFSQTSQRHNPGQPPLPHQVQAHFHGAPQPSFGLSGPTSGLRPGSNGYFCGFDSLQGFSSDRTRQLQSVVLSGYEGGVDVFAIAKTGLERVASIDGLRGGVYNAKVIPWTAICGDHSMFPLIALVVHGPVFTNSAAIGNEHTGKEQFTAKSDNGRSTPANGELGLITHYRTTVELFSLSTNAHLSTLLSMPASPLKFPVDHTLFSAPLPAGSLSLIVDSGTLVVSSGTTGEVWIFRQQSDPSYQCVGKIWAAVQSSSTHGASSPAELDEADVMFGESRVAPPSPRAAILSLKGRWLAYSPCVSTDQVSMRAIVHAVAPNAKVPGLGTYAPPLPPSVTCATDAPDPEKFLSQVTRVVAQGVVKGAKYMAKEGYTAWNNYWTSGSAGQYGGNSSRAYSAYSPENAHFPPTHGEGIPPSLIVPKPDLVSILDLDELAHSRGSSASTSPSPTVTFKLPLGCSFISFAPSGLALFTASGNGDVQIVWDLMRILYTKSSLLQVRHSSSMTGLHVRQIALFTRLTVARIVDVIWSSPHGEHIAMLTERNTVHFLDLPATAFTWPPSRRRTTSVKQAEAITEPAAESKSPTTLTSSAANVVKGLKGYAVPFMSKPRGMSGSGRPTITPAGIANAGSGFVSGLSKSMGAAASGTVEHFRKAGENKLHLPFRAGTVTAGCVKWLGSQRGGSLASLVDGVINIYSIKQDISNSKPGKQRTSIGSRPVRLTLPPLVESLFSPVVILAMGLDQGHLDLSQPIRGFNRLTKLNDTKAGKLVGTESSIPQAEIESNPPYQPFHTDRRVGLYVYENGHEDALDLGQYQEQPTRSQQDLHAGQPLLDGTLKSNASKNKCNKYAKASAATHSISNHSNWIFGQPIAAIRLDVGQPYDEEDDDSHAPAFSDMERVTSEQSEQIVITTRRRKGGANENGGTGNDGDGFFEDDCEVLDFANQRV